MNCSELIASLLPCKHIFLLPGGGNAPLVEAFADRAVTVLHEHTAAVAAEAYAQITGLGCALVTTGPGVTNAMTGLAAAWLDGTPLVLLSGQVKREYIANNGLRQRGFQELPNRSLTGAITKCYDCYEPLKDARDVGTYVHAAIAAAKTPRQGPVHIDVPLDIQTAESPSSNFKTVQWPSLLDVGNAVDRAVELLKAAERPVLLLGHGARCEEVRELIESIGLPTLLTWRAADFLEEEHPLFCGRPGIAGQRGANIVQQSADLLICVGARLDLGQTGYDVSLFATNATKFVVDVDEAEAKKHRSKYDREGGKVWWDHAVCDGPSFLRELAEQVKPTYTFRKIDRKGFGSGGVSKFADWSCWCRQTFVDNRPRNAFYDAMSDALRPDDVIVTGSSGAAAESMLQHIHIKQGQRLVFSPGLGAMGFGLPAAIGAHLATGRRVVCVEGDGSLAMNSYELETVRRMRLPIKMFVIRNGGYASIKRSQKRQGYKEVVPSVPDPLKLARMYGVPVLEMHEGQSLGNTLCLPCMIAVDANCELSHRMKTVPPGRPEDMVPSLEEVKT